MNRQQQVDKHAKVLMLVVSVFIIMLLIIALSGCNRHKDTETETYIEEYHGKEGKSEYGEYEER